MGEGKHLKLAVTADGARSGAIAFGQGSQLDRYRRQVRYDVAFKLAANQWNGAVSPQLVVKRIFDTPERFEDLRLALVAEWKAGPAGVVGIRPRRLHRARRRGGRLVALARRVGDLPHRSEGADVLGGIGSSGSAPR